MSDRGTRSDGFDLARASDYVRAAGLQLTEIGAQPVAGYLDRGSRHHTPWGVVHGVDYGGGSDENRRLAG